MRGLKFLFAVHCHQPVGNFGHVFEKAFDACYEPFLAAVERHPAFRFAIHFSGPLWEYMERRRPDCLALVGKLAGRGQAELLGGGFYEPILGIIPEKDRIGQLRMMSEYLETIFGKKPRGIWLTERVWEPDLPKALAAAGIEYTLLDEEHFHYAGVRDIHTSYITEESGFPLRVFPIDKKLRYLIPFRGLDDIRAYLEEIRAGGGAAILGDDGEKFGLWPGTHEWVYGKNWLADFLEFLEGEGIRTMTLADYADESVPGGRVYLPPASYEEMMEWVLEPSDLEAFRRLKKGAPSEAARFLRGGLFKDFFLKYPEANHLHKRMLSVSKRLETAGNDDATRALYRAQGNDPYWHGVFGGLYLPHLREAAYGNLIEAEKKSPPFPGWRREDVDLDGLEEHEYWGDPFSLVVKPSRGGAFTELAHLPSSRNITDVLSRRRESYHQTSSDGRAGEGGSIHELAKKLPPGAEDLVRYDRYPRYSLVDHFLHPQTGSEDFRKGTYGEQGDFVDQAYVAKHNGPALSLERHGSVWDGRVSVPVTVHKRILPEAGLLAVDYLITNRGKEAVSLVFASEWSFYMIPEEFEVRPDGAGLLNGRLSFRATVPAEVWNFPLRTLSQSEKGYDIIHQGFCIVPLWKIQIPGKETASFEIRLIDHDIR
jgi:4-alpha-glucanotransferase